MRNHEEIGLGLKPFHYAQIANGHLKKPNFENYK
jgi:hypothetical protein